MYPACDIQFPHSIASRRIRRWLLQRVQELNLLIQSRNWTKPDGLCHVQLTNSWHGAGSACRTGNKTSVFLIADIKISDGTRVPDSAANVHHLVARHGDRYLSRSVNIETVEGTTNDSTLTAVIEFPSRTALGAFAADPDYVPYGKARKAGSISNFHVIDDTDIAGAIDYLPAG